MNKPHQQSLYSAFFWISVVVFAVVLFTMLLLGGCYLDTSEEHEHFPPTEPPPPVAGDDDDDIQCTGSFTWSQTPGTTSVSFRGEAQPRVCTEARYDFGDGTGSSRDLNTVHRYPAIGDYIARLTVCPTADFTDERCDDASATVIVSP